MAQIQFNESTAREIMGGVTRGTIKTRDGFPVRLLDYNLKGRYPLCGVVDLGDEEYCHKWTREGKNDFRSNVTTNYDLVLEVEGGEA